MKVTDTVITPIDDIIRDLSTLENLAVETVLDLYNRILRERSTTHELIALSKDDEEREHWTKEWKRRDGQWITMMFVLRALHRKFFPDHYLP